MVLPNHCTIGAVLRVIILCHLAPYKGLLDCCPFGAVKNKAAGSICILIAKELDRPRRMPGQCAALGPWCRLRRRSPAKNPGYPVIFRSLSNTPTSPKARLFFGTVLHFLEMIGRVRVKRRPKARERLEGNAPRSRKRAERVRGTGDSCRVVITLMQAPAALLVRAPA